MKYIFCILVCLPAFIEALDLSKLKNSVNFYDGANLTGGATTVSSKGPDVTGSKYYVYLTGASYCAAADLKAFTCAFCKKATGQAFNSILSNETYNTQALVTTNSAKKEIVVTFRGSYNVANFVEDAALTKTDVSQKSTTIMVHKGFLGATLSLYPQVVSTLNTLMTANKGYSVVITGHSLGAAMASITLYMLQNKISTPASFPSPSFYAKYVYGEPRVGNKAYADYWNSQSIQISRIVNNADIVPHATSAKLGYLHHGTELWISKTDVSCSKAVYEDQKCSDSLGPLYNPLDHLKYWDVDYTTCAQGDAIAVLTQFAVPLSL